MANTNFTVHNGLTVGPTSIDAASGTIYANASSGTNSAYVLADANYVHVGSASATQLNFKMAGQTPTFIAANGSVIITGNTSLNSSGAGNLFVRNNTGAAVGMAITDAVSFHVGTVTNSQFNLKQNNTTQAWLDTTGNFNVNQNLLVTGNLNVSGTITSTSTTNISTNNKNLILANNQSTGSAVNGSGLLVGNATVASWLFNNATTSWQSNINIMPTNNNVWNLGGVSNYWNTVYGTTFVGTSTTAQYADVAEKYTSDAQYEPGTVVDFGGEYEVTLSNINGSQYVAGVVSTNPAYLMNNGLEEGSVAVALTGRVPTKVTGPVRKGQMMVSNGDGTARAENNPTMGSVIGKSLENFPDGTGVIEVVVGRL